MFQKEGEGNIFEDFQIGQDKVQLSRLQYSHETVIFCSCKKLSFLNLNFMLAYYEMIVKLVATLSSFFLESRGHSLFFLRNISLDLQN